MTYARTLALFFIIGFGITGITACEDQGPAEKFGEQVDEAGEETLDAMKEACENIKDKAEADKMDC